MQTEYIYNGRLLEICYVRGREFPPAPGEIPYKIYRTIIKGISKKRVVKLHYCDADYEIAKRMVIPEALVWRDGLWYLAAFCLLRGEARTFRVDRILKARETDERQKSTGLGKEVKKHGLFGRPDSRW